MTKRTPDIIATANKVLSNFLNATNPLQKLTGSDIWRFRGNVNSFITKDNKEGNIVIWPFPVNEDLEAQASSYPFYLSVTIILEATESIKELNIKIFKEDLSKLSEADIKSTELLLRAEWVNEINDHHAQPHWHIHSYTLIDELGSYSPEKQRSIRELLDEDLAIKSIEAALMDENLNNTVEVVGHDQEKTQEDSLPMFKFHLSMLSDWDREYCESQCKTLDINNLKPWLEQCLNYIQVQIEYLLRKLPNK